MTMCMALLHHDTSSANPDIGTANPFRKPLSRTPPTTSTVILTPRTIDDMQHPRMMPIRHPWKRVRERRRVLVRSNHCKSQTICRTPGSFQKAEIPLPIELSHLTAQPCLTMVDADDEFDAIEDLLPLVSSSFWVSESPRLVCLNLTLGYDVEAPKVLLTTSLGSLAVLSMCHTSCRCRE